MAAAVLALSGLTAAHPAPADDNVELAILHGALMTAHNSALVVSFFSPEPLAKITASAVTYGTNLGLKESRAVFVTPNDWSSMPNSADGCSFDFTLPQAEASYSNFLGYIDFRQVPEDWGQLTSSGEVWVSHRNTGVEVSVAPPRITPGQSPQQVRLPSGTHAMKWRAETQISDAFDVILPGVLLGFNIGYYGANWAAQGQTVARQIFLQQKSRRLVVQAAITAGAIADGQLDILGTRTTATHERDQVITIYKQRPPQISTEQSVMTLQATDFGGVNYARVADQLRATIQASDPCDRPFTLSNNAGRLLEMGSNTITWTISDTGPRPGGGGHSDELIQTVIVEDTQAPILVAPPGRVIEAPSGLNADEVILGAPRVVDLADPAPTVEHDGPSFYPLNSRSPITWTATDASGNSSQADQLITIKEPGTNTAPTVTNVVANTLTSQPVDIVLTGSDPDFLDGRFDPLSFRISQRPANGEFVAPLMPFFIEDYRTQPGGPYGEPFLQAGTPSQQRVWLHENVCVPLAGLPFNERIQRDWVHQPLYVHVTDEGLVVMIDHYFNCRPSDVSSNKRISFWDADGEYIDQFDYTGSNDTFVVDQDSFLYTLNRNGSGTSTELNIGQSMNSINQDNPAIGGNTWRIDQLSATNPDLGLSDYVHAASLSYARVDTREGLLYVTDRRRVFVFDVFDDLNDGDPGLNNLMYLQYRGALYDGERFLCTTSPTWGNNSTGFAMDVDPDGNLYIADSCSHRIHKFTPSTRDAAGQVVLGEHVGWLGRCETSTNNACDEEKQTSKGYSCTDDTCFSSVGWAGAENGQFSDVEFIALDPNGVLYATDMGGVGYEGGRVQRFASDGSFGGVARSTGTGINQGDQPGFVLGNLGTVRAVSVNSTQFYVVDREESFVHVFETSPLKDITDDSVTVTYVSNFNFHSDTDSFQFIASDGLADSNIGTAVINVERNFRAPIAHAQSVETLEDVPLDITLSADDPDGIIGFDFNGLDILSYQIVEAPLHGTLAPVSSDNATATLTYTPDPDYYGSDQFVFVANDGVDDSEPATVKIEVIYVDDPPRVTSLSVPPRVGLGFAVTISGEFKDDGATGYTTRLTPGDGSPALSKGGVNDNDPDNPFIEGVLLIEPPLGRGTGRAVAHHVYTAEGPWEIDWCVADQLGREDCKQLAVEPEPLVSLGVDLPGDHGQVPLEPIQAGENFFVDVVIANLEPSGVAGLIAQAISMTGTIDAAGVTFTGASEVACQISADGKQIDCDFGDFQVGEERSVRLFLASDGDSLDDVIAAIDLSITTTSPAVSEVMSTSAVRVIDSVIGIFRDRLESPL
ncbi:MAG: hypothetical protein LAT56_00025 [Wenzhouxiangella sp.]|nr:hypothetical protein [Wenzhouxiangella sp.]